MVRQDKLRHLPDRFPLACQWELTCRCNLHCVMCYTDCFNRPERIREELGTEEIFRIMDELADAGTLELCLTGGEPLARQDFFTLYDHAVRLGFLVTVFTNGTLIREDEADHFVKLPPQRIEISLHASTPEGFDRVTQCQGSYRRCLDAIELLRARRIPLVLKTTALTLNRHDILTIKSRVDRFEGTRFQLGEDLRPELDGGDGPFRYALSRDELDALHAEDPALQREACARSRPDTSPCRSGLHRFHIDAVGRLQLCSGNRRSSYDLRSGSFREGFFEALPTFACQWKRPQDQELSHPSKTNHGTVSHV
ncbi:hypothetical protein YTPLAS18_16800 [Nitrospira sp.]|nr:hypothetical protein YTPLAS18_16800 [Nitrospira sp.]